MFQRKLAFVYCTVSNFQLIMIDIDEKEVLLGILSEGFQAMFFGENIPKLVNRN